MEAERLAAFQEVDIREVNRDEISSYEDIILDLGRRKTDKVEAFLNRSDNPYIYEDMGYVVKSVFQASSSLSYVDCTKQLVAKKAGLA
jgi:hypothetical protein